MIACLTRLHFSRLTAAVPGLAAVLVCTPLSAQVTLNHSKLPGNRAPSDSPALRGASQRSPGTRGTARSTQSPSRLLSPRGETVQLPYNMEWSDTPQRLASLFAGVGAKVADKKSTGQTEVWTVQGLIAPDLQASLFTFQAGSLTAMEFDYGQTDWDLPKYNEKMGLLRRVMEGRCGGPGELVSRDTAQEPGSTVKQTFTGYHWSRGDTLVELFYFSAEDTAKSLTFRTISVHYRYKDPVQDQQPMPETEVQAADPNSNPLFGGTGASAAVASPSPSVGSGSPVATPAVSPPAKPSPTGPDGDPLPEH